jgi:23S rRNA (adenine1618-N6)-methyltransferase
MNSDHLRVGQRINETLSQLPLKWMWRPSISAGLGFSEKAVWSRASRRHMAAKQGEGIDEDSEMGFGFKVRVEANLGGEAGSKVTVRWIKGHDSVIFESLCGMLKRKVEEAANQ